MISQELIILIIAAASLGFFHTLFGPDHYLPFIVMSRARKWGVIKTIWITLLCGIGHIMSSVLIGFIGVACGIAVTKLEVLESFRGNIAAWMFIAFGLAYFVWGLRRALRGKPHKHLHPHGDGSSHIHNHIHEEEHVHIHAKEKDANLTPWILFTIFVFGPCEPLIPILMYPAAKNSLFGVILVTGVFGSVTILTMLSIVMLSYFGIRRLAERRLEKYIHAIAGATIFASGMAIQFLGL